GRIDVSYRLGRRIAGKLSRSGGQGAARPQSGPQEGELFLGREEKQLLQPLVQESPQQGAVQAGVAAYFEEIAHRMARIQENAAVGPLLVTPGAARVNAGEEKDEIGGFH